MKFNPIKGLKEKSALLGSQMKEIGVSANNQTKLLQMNVEIMQKQSLILERSANAAEAQATILQKIFEEIEKKE